MNYLFDVFMEPTFEEAERIFIMAALFGWARLTGDLDYAASMAGSILLALGVKPEDDIGISEFATFPTDDTEAMMNGSWLYSSRHGPEEDDNDPLDGMTTTPSPMINDRFRNALDGPDVVGP